MKKEPQRINTNKNINSTNKEEYTIIEPNIKNVRKARFFETDTEKAEIRNGDIFEICTKNIDKCGAELKALGDYPEVEKVRQVIEKYQFTDPLEIKDHLLERFLNNTDTPCAFGIRLGAFFCVAYNYIGSELEDEQQLAEMWAATERANDAVNHEFGGKLSAFDIDRLVSMGARQDEAFVLARLLGIDHESAKAIVKADENIIDINKIRKQVNDYVQSQVQIIFEDLKSEFEYRFEERINEIRTELGLEPVEEEEIFEDEQEDEPLPLFKTGKPKPDYERQQ